MAFSFIGCRSFDKIVTNVTKWWCQMLSFLTFVKLPQIAPSLQFKFNPTDLADRTEGRSILNRVNRKDLFVDPFD